MHVGKWTGGKNLGFFLSLWITLTYCRMSPWSQRWQLHHILSSLLMSVFSHCSLFPGKGGENRSPALHETAGSLWIRPELSSPISEPVHRFQAVPGYCLWSALSSSNWNCFWSAWNYCIDFWGQMTVKIYVLNYDFRKRERERTTSIWQLS